MDHVVWPLIDWSAAGRPRPGESESGDAYLVRNLTDAVLVAVVDGLGHGAEAARASRAAIAVADAFAASSLAQIAMRCHEALRETRGAVLTLARIDGRQGTLTWLGIGNVAAVLIRGHGSKVREVLVPRGGLVGHQLANLVPASLSVSSGDTLIVTTDGVNWDPDDGPLAMDAAGPMARGLLDAYAVTTDDATVVVVRCR
jgi:negative regulator of sigma-B (phosphoserine phosphatase)